MRILVNALGTRRGGSEVFVKSLLPELIRMDPSVQYTALISADRAHLFTSLRSTASFIEIDSQNLLSFAKRLRLEHVYIPRIIQQGGYDWLFQADDMLSPVTSLMTRSLVVFHASIQFVFPNSLGDPWLKVMYWNWIKRLALRRATIPVTVSFCAKGELARANQTLFERLQVIYHGIDHHRFSPTPENDETSLNALPAGPYILSVSTRNPHKNYFRLVRAYHKLLQMHPVKENLLVIGSPVSDAEEKRIRAFVEAHGLEQRVHFRERMEHSVLPQIYRLASVYVYPSLYDSFGLTPLEAMACGTPTAVSFFSAMPEICGDAADYFDPLDVDDIARSLQRILCDERRRNDLSLRGLEHSRRYSWGQAAAKYHQLLTAGTAPTWEI